MVAADWCEARCTVYKAIWRAPQLCEARQTRNTRWSLPLLRRVAVVDLQLVHRDWIFYE